MDNSQDELGIDNENNRTIFLRESDPFLPVIPLPEIEEEPLGGGLNAPPTTPLHSPPPPPPHISQGRQMAIFTSTCVDSSIHKIGQL